MMLARAVMQLFARPKELGGTIAVFPIEDFSVFHGTTLELMTDWYGPTGVGPQSPVDNFGDGRSYQNGWSFEGNAWTIQLSARPGLYVSPDVLTYLGYEDGTQPPYG